MPSLEFVESLPDELVPLVATLGSAVVGAVGMFLNRHNRAINELDRLLDMRGKCEAGTAEAESLDLAIRVLSPRLSRKVRRRINPIGVATFSIVGALLLGFSYILWSWATSVESALAAVVAFVVTFGSLIFLAGGLSILSKVEGEEVEGETTRASKTSR